MALPPFIGARPQKILTLPVVLSGFRLAHFAGPIRHQSGSLGPRGSAADRVGGNTAANERGSNSAFQIVKDRYETPFMGAKGVFMVPKRRNPGSAFWMHQPGFL